MRPWLLLVLVAAALAAAPPAAGAATAKWTKLDARGPGVRADAALAAPSATTAYLHGGTRGGRALGDLWRLDVKRKRWTRLRPANSPPLPRFGHDLVAQADGSLLLFGGQSGEDFFGDLWRYDPRTNAWSDLTTSGGPAPRYGAGVAIDRPRGVLYVTHGFTNDGRFDDTWALPGDLFEDVSSPPGSRPLARCLVSAAHSGGGLFLFGGQSNSRPFLDDLWRYDTAGRTWSELQPTSRPSPRHSYGSAQTGRRWLIHGGATRGGPVRDLWALDLADPGSFTRVRTRGRSPSGRADQAMTALSGSRALVFGGSTLADELGDTWLVSVTG